MSFFGKFRDFFEILNGVIDDNKAKIIRWICFLFLIIGIGWGIFNYFLAGRLVNTNIDALESESHAESDDGRALKHMADLAQTVQDMRHGGMTIAEAIASRHSRPFNVNDLGEYELRNLENANASLDLSPANQTAEDKAPEIFVRAIMLKGDTRAAVLDAGEGFKGHMVRKGTILPNELGQVTNITANKVVIRRNRRNFEYIVGKLETDLERKLKGKAPNANNSNSSRPGQTQMGVEQFVFEGTVPDNSPLTTSVKEEELKK